MIQSVCASWTVVTAKALERNPGAISAGRIAAAYPTTTTFNAGPDSLCGNCVLSPGETCDDGNTTPGDGCSTTCQVEPCFTCPNGYSCAPSPGVACPSDNNPCTLDQCDGTGACTHPPGNAGTECRASAGPCDLAESCSGTSATCPTDAFQPSTTVCRAAVDVCDVAERRVLADLSRR